MKPSQQLEVNYTQFQLASSTSSVFSEKNAFDYPLDFIFYFGIVPIALFLNVVCGVIVRRLLKMRKTLKRLLYCRVRVSYRYMYRSINTIVITNIKSLILYYNKFKPHSISLII